MRSDIFDQSNLEVATGQRFVLQNPKMLKVTLGEPVLAAKGAMVAYQGSVQFHHKGSDSLAKFVKRAVSSDDQALMTVAGQGEVFFARFAEDVFLIQLEGDAISVGGSSLLAFDAALQWDLHRTRGAGMMTGGMFNTLIHGHGSVALSSHGKPVILDCSQQPTFVDPNAAVCWSANLVPDVVSSMNMSSLLRGGSGEAFQYKFHGPGFVVVQPSEGIAGIVQPG
ncbi:AIM24 family protein [Cellulomonas wangsupingiae]|uniref:AIM24 family protein n=1 Tax=Cellulomonas wangsupingiae TaxID=2968085 RepID=A0ABY5K7A5_9CELL|nr:AIM24 family protein [Cellulomonas wangsupingiae]MCC2334246.1 AIM24 family protein [Cellulomonas wangsupingiae]MCM0641246.1 AIM24 family protein [Cellulomonas wangsupingiae]UUI65923.1 AIM24 family protein [Cellulomonas wangsupingiae]